MNARHHDSTLAIGQLSFRLRRSGHYSVTPDARPTRDLACGPSARPPLAGSRPRVRNATGSGSSRDLLGFRGADAFGAEGRVWISQVTPREVVRCAEGSAPIGTGNTQSTIQWPKSSMNHRFPISSDG